MKNYNFLTNLDFPVSGLVDANISLNGNFENPTGKIDVNVQDLKYKDYLIPLIDLSSRISPKQILFDRCNLNINNSLLKIRGYKNIFWDIDSLKNIMNSKGLNLTVDMKEDSLNFLKYINPEVDILTGDITALTQ